MKTAIRSGDRYFGVEITPEGRLIVAERGQGRPAALQEYPAGPQGAQAFRSHVQAVTDHPHVCIRACGAAALTLATSLIPTPGVEVTLVTSQALAGAPAASQPEQRAERLARLAERLF